MMYPVGGLNVLFDQYSKVWRQEHEERNTKLFRTAAFKRRKHSLETVMEWAYGRRCVKISDYDPRRDGAGAGSRLVLKRDMFVVMKTPRLRSFTSDEALFRNKQHIAVTANDRRAKGFLPGSVVVGLQEGKPAAFHVVHDGDLEQAKEILRRFAVVKNAAGGLNKLGLITEPVEKFFENHSSEPKRSSKGWQPLCVEEIGFSIAIDLANGVFDREMQVLKPKSTALVSV